MKLRTKELLILAIVAIVLLGSSKILLQALIDGARADQIELERKEEKAKCTRFKSGHRRPRC